MRKFVRPAAAAGRLAAALAAGVDLVLADDHLFRHVAIRLLYAVSTMTAIHLPVRRVRRGASRAPLPTEVWLDVWTVTIRWHPRHDTAGSPETIRRFQREEQVADCVLRATYDPRIRDVSVTRSVALDTSAAARSCGTCEEPYRLTRPRRYRIPCHCGGHLALACLVCGDTYLYPRLAPTCAPSREARYAVPVE